MSWAWFLVIGVPRKLRMYRGIYNWLSGLITKERHLEEKIFTWVGGLHQWYLILHHIQKFPFKSIATKKIRHLAYP